MILPDINLLLYAYNKHSPCHLMANSWWKRILNSQQTILLPYEIIFGFIRIATNARLGEACISLATAKDTVNSWLVSPYSKVILPDSDHFKRVMTLMADSNSQGAMLSDAILASYAIFNGATLCSNDDDFNRFEHLIWHNPIQ